MKRVLWFGCFLFASLLLARLWVNSALLWEVLSVVPRSAWVFLVAVLESLNSPDVHAQEELLEFVASWLVALVSLATIVGVGLIARKLAHGKQNAA